MDNRHMDEHKIKDVSDTALMIAAYRALETERHDALFQDPLAARLAGELGRNIIAKMPKIYRMTAWSVAIRTRIIDDFILDSIAQGVDTILNLGAGLDTRPYRMKLPADLIWVEVDYPQMIARKELELAQEQPNCQLQRHKLDLADHAARNAMLAELNAKQGRVLVLLEGVVPYLEEAAVKDLISALRAQQGIHYLITDYFSPQFLKLRERGMAGRGMENAPWKFNPSHFWDFFRQQGWAAKEVRYLYDETRQLHRKVPYPLMINIILTLFRPIMPRERREEFRKSLAYVLFEAV